MTGSSDGTIALWDQETGARVWKQLGHRGQTRHLTWSPRRSSFQEAVDLALSPDQRFLAATLRGGTILVFELAGT